MPSSVRHFETSRFILVKAYFSCQEIIISIMFHMHRDTVAMGWDQTLIKIDEKGATFRSYVDGSIHHLTPERSIDIQRQLGADLIVGDHQVKKQ